MKGKRVEPLKKEQTHAVLKDVLYREVPLQQYFRLLSKAPKGIFKTLKLYFEAVSPKRNLILYF